MFFFRIATAICWGSLVVSIVVSQKAAFASPPRTLSLDQEGICRILESKTPWPLTPSDGDQLITAFYVERRCQPLFHKNQLLTKVGRDLSLRIARAFVDGFDPEDFLYSSIYSRVTHPKPTTAGQLDILLTRALFRYVLVLRGMNPDSVDQANLNLPLLRRTLLAAFTEADINTYLDYQAPQHTAYKQLTRFLGEHHLNISPANLALVRNALKTWQTSSDTPSSGDIVINPLAYRVQLWDKTGLLWEGTDSPCKSMQLQGVKPILRGVRWPPQGALSTPLWILEPPLECFEISDSLGLLKALLGSDEIGGVQTLMERHFQFGGSRPLEFKSKTLIHVLPLAAWIDKRGNLATYTSQAHAW